MTPMPMDDLIGDPRWPKAKDFYAEGYHDAKDKNHRNTYPVGSLRWHAYERGFIIADEWFNKKSLDNPPAADTLAGAP
jgi:hypothetical protein